MKKLFYIFVLFSSIVFANDLLIGFGYGYVQGELEDESRVYRTDKVRDLTFKAGYEFDESRLILSYDNVDIKKGEDLNIYSISLQAIDKTDTYIKGFFGVTLANFDYSRNFDSKSVSTLMYGIDLGVVLLEDAPLDSFELEFGFKYYTTKGLSSSSSLALNDFSGAYIGMNYKF